MIEKLAGISGDASDLDLISRMKFQTRWGIKVYALCAILHNQQTPERIAVDDHAAGSYVSPTLFGNAVLGIDLLERQCPGLLDALAPGKQGQHHEQRSTYTKTSHSPPRDHGNDDPTIVINSLCTKVTPADYKNVMVDARGNRSN
jgi:hypothetical protein